MHDTWTNIKIAERCAGVNLDHDRVHLKTAISRFPDFQHHRTDRLKVFARTNLLLSTDLVPLSIKAGPVDLASLLHAVLYRVEAIKSDHSRTDERLPWFETTVDGKAINQKLDNAHTIGSLSLIDYVVGKILNAVTSAVLSEPAFSFQFKVDSADSNLSALINYVASNAKITDLLRKVVVAKTKKASLDVAYESPADVISYTFTQEFSSDDFKYGQIDRQAKSFFVSSQPEVAQQLGVSVANEDLREDIDYSYSENSIDFDDFGLKSLDELETERQDHAQLQRALNVAGKDDNDDILNSIFIAEDDM